MEAGMEEPQPGQPVGRDGDNEDVSLNADSSLEDGSPSEANEQPQDTAQENPSEEPNIHASCCRCWWSKNGSNVIQVLLLVTAIALWTYFFRLTWYQLSWFVPAVLLFAIARWCPSEGL